ncbi:pentapeptide repeat protein [Stackebrandtia endophytica]|uniref:Pentapeptide repeat protein n=1 Tax=Stackebrandtia endophytica TaxID=1496996 RepID=A0A543AQB2_9ACTN|nr:pentapeptide repeat-containing protein [Stackebrandtia endophytica]TQL74749.1 pentapeptide repeat protein [Stackebrandtia endophytica]
MGIWKPGDHNTSGHRLPLIVHIGLILTLALSATWGLWRLWSGTWEVTLTENLNDQSRFEVAKIVLAIVGGLGGIVFLTIGYRKQRDAEAAETREQAKHFHERFGAAADQLGSEAPRIRLAGVYAMAALAGDWDAGRQTCIDVLCGYIRAPYEPPRALDHDPTDEALKEHRAATEEREIRRAIIDTIGERLRTAPRDGKTWHGHRYDLTRAILDTGNLSGIMVTPGTVIDLSHTQFPIGRVDFARARFSGGIIDFTGAKFNGATVDFTGAKFCDGTVDFTGANFGGCTIYFQTANFDGGTIDFRRASFGGGTINFSGASFGGGTINFSGARFESASVNFTGAKFRGGTVDFREVAFSGRTVNLTPYLIRSEPPVIDDFLDGPPEGLLLPSSR